MYICPFSRSDGAGNATTRNTRGLTRSVMALMVPPLPAASRPSNTTTTRSPSRLTQSCKAHSSTCSLRSAFSYSLRFIGVFLCGGRPAAGGGSQRHGKPPRVVKCLLRPAEHFQAVARGLRRSSLQRDVLQYPVAAGLALVGQPARGGRHRVKHRRSGRRLDIFCRLKPRTERRRTLCKVGRRLPIAAVGRQPGEIVVQLVQMVERVAQPDETRLEIGKVEGFERQRFQEELDLSDRVGRRRVTDSLAGKRAANGLDRGMGKLEDRPPGGLQRDRSAGLGKCRVEVADSGVTSPPRDALDQARETAEPRVERQDPDQLENTAEPGQRQDPVRIIKLRTYPVAGRCDRT